jgi:hypothetical protein
MQAMSDDDGSIRQHLHQRSGLQCIQASESSVRGPNLLSRPPTPASLGLDGRRPLTFVRVGQSLLLDPCARRMAVDDDVLGASRAEPRFGTLGAARGERLVSKRTRRRFSSQGRRRTVRLAARTPKSRRSNHILHLREWGLAMSDASVGARTKADDGRRRTSFPLPAGSSCP